MLTARTKSALAALLVAALAPAALAAEAGNKNPLVFDVLQYVLTLVVFSVVLAILATQVWPKILGGLEAREKKIRSEVFAAEDLRKQAAKEKADFERALSDARAEAQRLIEQTRAEQLRLAADLRVKAEAEAAELREQALANIEAAKRAAIHEIYRESASLATAIAEKILRREVRTEDHRRLAQESVEQFTREFAAR